MKGPRPILLGIVGDSAAGKTTLTRGLVNILGAGRVTHVCTDDYHKYDRAERARLGITPLHPDCNYVDVMELHLERLHYGQPILKPVYDHASGTLVRPDYVLASEFVIVEGLLGFLTPTMRQFYDVKVFLDPPEDLRWVWKMKRDTSKRGYTLEEVRAERERREPDSRAFVRPQREHADIVVGFAPRRPPRPAPDHQPSRPQLPAREERRDPGHPAEAGPRPGPPGGPARDRRWRDRGACRRAGARHVAPPARSAAGRRREVRRLPGSHRGSAQPDARAHPAPDRLPPAAQVR
jgi:uridine kinase